MRATFDEMVRAHICHDLCTWKNLDMKFLLQLVELLVDSEHTSPTVSVCCCITFESVFISIAAKSAAMRNAETTQV